MRRKVFKPAVFLLVGVLLLSLALPAWAAEEQMPEPTQQQLAQLLYDLGLFRGTDQGFELDRPMTRAEAAVMVTRFFGGEKEALEQNKGASFRDVPGWAAPYVGWLQRNGLTQGISKTKYGSSQQITFVQFAVMLNRRLDPNLSYEDCVQYGCQIANQDQMAQGDRPILRGEAAELAANGLHCVTEVDYFQNLAMALLEQGAFTLEAWEKAAAPVWGYEYRGYPIREESSDEWQIEKRVLNVVVAHSQPLLGCPVELCRLGNEILYTVEQEGQLTIYAADRQTLALRQVGQPFEGRYAWDWGWLGDSYYFVSETQEGDLIFYRTDGQDRQMIQQKGLVFDMDKDPKFNGTYRLRQLPQGLFLCCPEGLYQVNQTGDGLEQVVGGVAVRDVAGCDGQLYYTTFTFVQTEYGWDQQDSAQILRLEPEGEAVPVFDGQALGLHPSRFSRVEQGKLYFFADDQAYSSPKGERYFEYCWDGQRVSVSQCWANGIGEEGFTGEQWAKKEQLRIDDLYRDMIE